MNLSFPIDRQFLDQLYKKILAFTKRVLRQQTNHDLILYTSFHLVFWFRSILQMIFLIP